MTSAAISSSLEMNRSMRRRHGKRTVNVSQTSVRMGKNSRRMMRRLATAEVDAPFNRPHRQGPCSVSTFTAPFSIPKCVVAPDAPTIFIHSLVRNAAAEEKVLWNLMAFQNGSSPCVLLSFHLSPHLRLLLFLSVSSQIGN